MKKGDKVRLKYDGLDGGKVIKHSHTTGVVTSDVYEGCGPIELRARVDVEWVGKNYYGHRSTIGVSCSELEVI